MNANMKILAPLFTSTLHQLDTQSEWHVQFFSSSSHHYIHRQRDIVTIQHMYLLLLPTPSPLLLPFISSPPPLLLPFSISFPYDD